jgi:hypothetical protein
MTEAAFVRLIIAQALPETEEALDLMQTERLPVGELCTIIREQLDVLWVLHRGQEGENRRKFDERLLANGWAEIREGLIRNAERAEAQLQRHVRRASR